ncbi:hypothetical protein ACIA74_42700 [Streptomyces sp. NPDC051658]|uniref:hypothetical protein n=1 Tax=Streptomyces sp. NPDC051658 TaxID=3365667 RepID=UPI00378B9ED5
MLPYFRLGFGSPPYRMLDDDGAGTFDASFRCHRIRRAIDNSYRYNEIIGILTDYAHGETCNEALLAIAAGGLRALTGYATACARVVDDVLACDCGVDGHEEVAETAMGALAPHDVVTRLADLTARVWEHIIAGPGIDPTPPGNADTVLSIDTYHAVWDSYSLPPQQGIPIRRAFIGTLTSSVELSGISPCGRLIDGIVTALTPQDQDHMPSQPRRP